MDDNNNDDNNNNNNNNNNIDEVRYTFSNPILFNDTTITNNDDNTTIISKTIKEIAKSENTIAFNYIKVKSKLKNKYNNLDTTTIDKMILGLIDVNYCPPDIDIELWYALDNNAKRSLLLNLVSLYREQEDLKTTVYQSRLIKFFVDFDSDEGSGVSVDAINALALINALLLTIPFGIMSLFSAEYVNDLYLAVESCPDGESKVFNRGVYVYVLNNLAACLYGSLCGLMITASYFMLKDNNSNTIKSMTLISKIKERILLLMLFVCTTASIIGLLDSAFIIFAVYCNPNICKVSDIADSNNVTSGVLLGFCFLFSIYLMC